MQPHIIFRADASTQMGTGHLMRCLALAQAWKDFGGQVIFITNCESKGLLQRLQEEGFDIHLLTNPYPKPIDWNYTKGVLAAHPNAWVVLDGYHFDPEYQESVRKAGSRLLVIDDYNHLPCYHADILLNQNVGAEMIPYVCDENTVGLFGPKYALLRTEFLVWKNKIQGQPERPRSILVTLGGADPDNVTLKVVRALLQMEFEGLEAIVVAGPANPNIKELGREIESAQKAGMLGGQAMQVVRDAYMPELMARADVAVSAGGSTCWELCFFGKPFLVIIAAENQRDIALGFDRAGVATCLGWHEEVTVQDIKTGLESLLGDKGFRREMSANGRRLVDGEGCSRVLQAIGGHL